MFLKEMIKSIYISYFVNKKSNKSLYSKMKNDSKLYKRCFIIGNGPSLSDDDLQLLKNECFFVSNKFLYFSKEYSPFAYFCQDSTILSNLYEDINDYKEAKYKLLNVNIIKLFKKINNKDVIYYKVNRKNYIKGLSPLFSAKPLLVEDGFTVTYSMIQMAVELGFKEIYLLGVDFNYTIINGKIDMSSYPKELRKGQTGALPNIQYNLEAYKSAYEYAKNNGVIIKNATRGGKLEVFERCNLEDIL